MLARITILKPATMLAALGTIVAIGTGIAPISAFAEGSTPSVNKLVHPVNNASDKPTRKPNTDTAAKLDTPTICTAPAAAKFSCVQIRAPRKNISPSNGDGASPQAIQPIPPWCALSDGQVMATRTESCEVTLLIYNTFRIINGVQQQTGSLLLDVYSYTYSAPDLPDWAHQISVSPFDGWGDAVKARVSGSASSSGDCRTSSSSFPGQPVTPFGTLRSGEAFFSTTATADGAVGYCTTNWNILFSNPTYTNASANRSLTEVRCDNVIGANLSRPKRVGCVVPWYPSAVFYSQSRYPSLASHVSRAQGSGLPGASIDDPLYRTTNQTYIDANRNLACGDAPSIALKSCDEYPLASTYNGLAFGGVRRTFDNCNISAPRATGPGGASACMITASENSAQGALMAAFYYDERVLDADPYVVTVSA